MWAEFRQTLLRRLRGQVIGWSIGLGLYAVMMIAFYPTVGQMNLQQHLELFPEELMAFIEGAAVLSTPPGYLETYFFNYMPIILGILAAGAGASLLVADEERGTLDLILAHPISRTALFSGRLLALAVAIAVILLVSWLCWAIPGPQFGMDLTWLEFLRPFIGLFFVLLLFSALGLLFSMLLPASRMAGMLTAAIAVGNYLLNGLANLDERLEPAVRLTPLRYYQGGLAVEGLNWGWVAGHVVATLILILAAWALFQRREIRVGGEQSWRLPDLARWLRKPPASQEP
jgi:ABC-2 type transport system permease protein